MSGIKSIYDLMSSTPIQSVVHLPKVILFSIQNSCKETSKCFLNKKVYSKNGDLPYNLRNGNFSLNRRNPNGRIQPSVWVQTQLTDTIVFQETTEIELKNNTGVPLNLPARSLSLYTAHYVTSPSMSAPGESNPDGFDGSWHPTLAPGLGDHSTYIVFPLFAAYVPIDGTVYLYKDYESSAVYQAFQNSSTLAIVARVGGKVTWINVERRVNHPRSGGSGGGGPVLP